GRRACVLDIVAHSERHIADVASLIVECARLTRGAEHAHPGLPLDIILPFVGVWMPMKLPHPPRINFDERCCNCKGYGKHPGIGDPDPSALCFDRLLRHHFMAEALWHRRCARDLV